MEQTKDSLKVQALTQRIAQLVAQYEEANADLRAEATITIESLNEALTQAQNDLTEANETIASLNAEVDDATVLEEGTTADPSAKE